MKCVLVYATDRVDTDHLRGIGVELEMAPVKYAVAIGGGEIRRVHPFGEGADMSAIDDIIRPSADAMFDDLVWWSTILTGGRTAVAA